MNGGYASKVYSDRWSRVAVAVGINFPRRIPKWRTLRSPSTSCTNIFVPASISVVRYISELLLRRLTVEFIYRHDITTNASK